MGDLILKGRLNLVGRLNLKDKVLIGDSKKEALVERIAPSDPPHSSSAPPVTQPPGDNGKNVWVINSFNKTVTAKGIAIVSTGLAMQGNTAIWPGMVLPSTNNPPGNGVTINHLAINVQGDTAIIFPSGGSASLDTSGQ
jgi:hypothetical protein